VDFEELRQKRCSCKIEISRKSFWEDLKAARIEVALSIMEKTIKYRASTMIKS
jgi:predicted DNA-binding protein (UPF0251 family)